MQRFRCNEIALRIGVECVHAHGHQIARGIVNLEPCALVSDGLAGLCIELCHMQKATERRIIQHILIGLAVLCDLHIEICDKCRIIDCLGLMHCVDAIGHFFCSSIAVFIRCQVITHTLICICIGTCGFQKDLKLRTVLQILHLIRIVIAVLDNGH